MLFCNRDPAAENKKRKPFFGVFCTPRVLCPFFASAVELRILSGNTGK
jgi:hypothetical protein